MARRKTLYNCYVLCLLFCSFFHCKFYARDPGGAHLFSPLWGIPLCASPTVHLSMFPSLVSFYGRSSGITVSILVRVSLRSRVLVPLRCRSAYQSCKTNDSQTGHVTPVDSGLGTRTGHRRTACFCSTVSRASAGNSIGLRAACWCCRLSCGPQSSPCG